VRCGSVKRAGGEKIFEAEKMWERVLEDFGDGIFVFAGGPTIFLSYLSIILPSQPLFTPIISTSSPKTSNAGRNTTLGPPVENADDRSLSSLCMLMVAPYILSYKLK